MSGQTLRSYRGGAVLLALAVTGGYAAGPGEAAGDPAAGAGEPPATYTRQLVGESPPATLDDVAWLLGQWRGIGLGGDVEEIWTRPATDVVCGMFTLSKNGAARFHEIFTLRPADESLVLVLKHFDAELKGWEEKTEAVRFPLVELTDDAVYFAGLTYRKEGQDRMVVYVNLSHGEGAAREARLELVRVTAAGP